MIEGDTLPDLQLAGADGLIRLADLRGRPLVIWFYPKDDTPGCTKEAQDFSAAADDFASLGVQLLGVSKDPAAKHAKFTAKHNLAVPLASDDEDSTVLTAFGAWGEKQLYGKTYLGIDRSTFLFDGSGTLVRAWRKVKVPGHVDQVLAEARALVA
ncbi:peroxiredoxin Q/BCP [Sphingomonas guangdongensis]|uniref:thioredoxin-dependent peroxiredoxin n=1 Tax=Sphingomonas guangdongensis TaxID=1141890 RepID=A0A285QZG4_9SPHN|nr:peroxiredoxin [Sphingomonas guangdongensis]SOB86898.1 peroxiredoxin Q/BCP [Sphingomonas guangdongensis]